VRMRVYVCVHKSVRAYMCAIAQMIRNHTTKGVLIMYAAHF